MPDDLADLNRQYQLKNFLGRYAICLAAARGVSRSAAQLAAEHYRGVPSLELALSVPRSRAIVEAADTTTSGWAGQLVPNPTLSRIFLDELRSRTILDRIPGVRRVPVNVTVPSQTTGGTYQWVGEASGKPVGALSLASATLLWAKLSGLLVTTADLIRFGSPTAETLINNDLLAGAVQFIDSQFLDATLANVDYVHPGGILNGVAATGASAGSSAANFKTDLKALLSAIGATAKDLRDVTLLMSCQNAVNLAVMGAEFSTLNVNGGTLGGMTVLASDLVSNRLIAIHGPSLLLSEGSINLALSTETLIEMDTAPAVGEDSPPSTQSVLKSMFQNDLVAFRTDREVNWKLGRANAVKWISGANYGS